MNLASFFDYRVDIHHIFPKAWCNQNRVDDLHRESIVNKTAISSDTNRRIGGRSPSAYLAVLEKRAQVSPEQLDQILDTHKINAMALRENDFSKFFEDRKGRLLQMIGDAMGKPANIDDENLESEINSFEPEPDEI